jgi:hypothetical protein
MNHTVYTGDDPLNLSHIRKIGGHKLFIPPEIRRRPDIARTNVRIDALEKPTEARADIARGPGNQNSLHGCHRIPFSAASFS